MSFELSLWWHVRFWFECIIGWLLWRVGFRPNISTGISDHTTYGYGDLDDNGYWQYVAPGPSWRKWKRCHHGYIKNRCGECRYEKNVILPQLEK